MINFQSEDAFFVLVKKLFEFYLCNSDNFCHLKTTFCKTRVWSKLFVVRTHTSQIQSLPTRGWIHQTFPTPGIRWSGTGGCGGSWIILRPSLGSFGLAPPQAKTSLAPPSLSAMSVILPYIAPLLLLLETNSEAAVDIAGA